jgi:hypothetical protein
MIRSSRNSIVEQVLASIRYAANERNSSDVENPGLRNE